MNTNTPNTNMQKLKIISEHDGHYLSRGSCSGQIRNNYRLVESNNEKFYQMDTEDGTSFYFSMESLPKVLRVKTNTMDFVPTWYKAKVGYIACHVPKKSTLYLHAWLKDHYGKGKGQISVDHINQNKLDNRMKNLRIVSQSIQNQNRPKKNRPKNAIRLPDELCGIQLPLHVTLNREKKISKKNGESYLYFFRIEKSHPKLKQNNKSMKFTKAQNINILDKYKIVKEKLYELNHENLDIKISDNMTCFWCNSLITSNKECKILDEIVCNIFDEAKCLRNKIVCNDCFDECSNKLICQNCGLKLCKKCLNNFDENYLCGNCKDILTTCEYCGEQLTLDDINHCIECNYLCCDKCSEQSECKCVDENKMKIKNKFLLDIDL